MINERIAEVREQIRLHCERVGRDPSEVTLIAVSKTKPLSMVLEAAEGGQIDFGENKVQEMCEKHSLASDKPLRWHLIGHLQSNKAKKAVSVSTMIHSVDSIALAKDIDRHAAQLGKVQDILLEINVAGEESKFGITLASAEDIVREIAKLTHVRLRGFMTVAPFVENAEDNRVHFRALKNFLVDINAKNIDNINVDVLSMGMSGDYGVAVEEGATHVRVGTYIFGHRDYTI